VFLPGIAGYATIGLPSVLIPSPMNPMTRANSMMRMRNSAARRVRQVVTLNIEVAKPGLAP
jgi:hypothetical protein